MSSSIAISSSSSSFSKPLVPFHFLMDYYLSVPTLKSGVVISNLVVMEDYHTFSPRFIYNINGRAISCETLTDVTPFSTSFRSYIYSVIPPFFFDSNGKEIIAFTTGCIEESSIEVVLYQENAQGNLFRLTPMSEKIKRGFGMCSCNFLKYTPFYSSFENNLFSTTSFVQITPSISNIANFTSLKTCEPERKEFYSSFVTENDPFFNYRTFEVNLLNSRAGIWKCSSKEGEKIERNVTFSTFCFYEIFGMLP